MFKRDIADIDRFDLDTLLGMVELLAQQEMDGQLTLLRTKGGWRVSLGTPDLQTDAHQAVMRLPSYSKLRDALVDLLLR